MNPLRRAASSHIAATVTRWALLLSVIACLAHCTLGEEPPATPVPVEVVATSPEPLSVDVPRNGPISFWFSQPLDPGSLGSRPIEVTSRGVRQGGLCTYDPIEYRLTYTPRGLLRLNLAYDATLDAELRGLRSGGAIESVPLTVVTGVETIDPPAEEPEPDFEAVVLPLLQGSCGYAGCHVSPAPAAGLDLSSPQGVGATAVGTPSNGWPLWARIDPGSAAWSYLIYKLTGEESVRGGPMPPDWTLPPEHQQTLARWIDGGAKVDQ